MFWNLIFTLYLILLSFLDIRKKELPLLLLFAGFPFVILYQIIGRKIGTGSTFFSTSPPSPSLIVSGMAVGIFFLLLSKVTRESFGYGDSILILLIGGLTGLWNLLSLLMIAVSTAALFSIFMLIRKHFSRKSSFPFVPFLTIAYIGGVLLGLY